MARLQINGYRFLLRRLEGALLGEDLATMRRPARGPSLTAGGLLAAVLVVGCALLALLRPQPGLGSAPIVRGAVSGALFVRVGDTLHPVLNLASARLIAATDATPRPVPESAIGRAHRGPTLGIPGAPHLLAPPLPADESIWTVCDTGSPPSTAVIVGPLEPRAGSATLRPAQTVLVTADSGATTYLLHGGRRTVVDLADPAVLRALRLAGQVPRPVSRLLLDTVPEAPRPPDAGAQPLAEGPAALCVSWAQPSPGRTEIALLAGAGVPLPPSRTPVGLAQADGGGPAVDAVYLPPDRSAYVQATDARYLVADTGVRFAVPDDDAARSLGLPATAVPAPWPMLAALPHGPQLSKANALVARDVVAGSRAP